MGCDKEGCNGSNREYDEWWACAKHNALVDTKELEQLEKIARWAAEQECEEEPLRSACGVCVVCLAKEYVNGT